ncbi:hypothetical protein ACOMHN_004101 [Nucella lapillus]
MLGKERDKANVSMYDIYIVGECIRSQLNKACLIKDRRYHLRKYRKCFVGRDAIDWLVKMCHAQSRGEAILAMRCLQDYGMLHHVVDDHVFKDQNLFYRFTRDDDHYLLCTDLAAFYHGLQVFCRVKESQIRRGFYNRGHLYQGAFYGVDLVDCLIANDDKVDREEVIQQCRQLLEFDIIRHVTDDYHFSDDRLMYQFHVDYDRPCLLSDVLHSAAIVNTQQSSSQQASTDADGTTPPGQRSAQDAQERGGEGEERGGRWGEGISIDSSSSNDNQPSQSSLDSSSNNSFLRAHSSDPRRQHGAGDHAFSLGRRLVADGFGDLQEEEEEEEEDERGMAGALMSAPFGRTAAVAAAAAAGAECWSGERGVMVRRVVKMRQDEVGYGFVLRGSSPCYVHTVDPLGPAAAAGLKEGQYVLSVNGQNMKKQDHRHVGRLVMAQAGLLTIVVLTQTNIPPH